MFYDGYTLEDILNKNNTFYLIRPYENLLTINIFWKLLTTINYSIYDDFFYHFTNALFLININKKLYAKTELFKLANDIYTSLEIPEIRSALILIAASAFDCDVEVYKIILLIIVLNNFSVKSLFKSKIDKKL